MDVYNGWSQLIQPHILVSANVYVHFVPFVVAFAIEEITSRSNHKIVYLEIPATQLTWSLSALVDLLGLIPPIFVQDANVLG